MKSAGPLESVSSRRSRRLSSSAGESNLARDAASSIASGKPSRRRQICATLACAASVSGKSGRVARARSTNSASDALRFDAAVASGRPSGGTGYTCSPYTDSASRLVTSTLRRGAWRSSSATCERAGSTCSKLSSTRHVCRARSRSASAASRSVAVRSETPSSRSASDSRTRCGSRAAASATNSTPSSKSDSTSTASWSASRVLPTPGGPVSVNRWTSGPSTSSRSSASRSSRPISRVGGAGKVRCRIAGADRAARRNSACAVGVRSSTCASRSASAREGRRSSASSLRSMLGEHPTRSARAACVKSSPRRNSLSRLPNDVWVAVCDMSTLLRSGPSSVRLRSREPKRQLGSDTHSCGCRRSVFGFTVAP